MLVLPELQHLRTVRQLCEEYPQIFTEGSLRWWIFRREYNGFSHCIVRIGKRLYIDLRMLRQWLAEHRGSVLEGSAVELSATSQASLRRVPTHRGRRRS